MVVTEARSFDGHLDVDGRGVTQSDPTILRGGGDWDVVAVLARSCYAHEKNVDRGTTLGILDPCLVANDLYEREVRHEHICGVLHDAHLLKSAELQKATHMLRLKYNALEAKYDKMKKRLAACDYVHMADDDFMELMISSEHNVEPDPYLPEDSPYR